MGSQIKKGAILSYIAIIVNITIGFLYTPWMIKSIGKSDYGIFMLVTSFLSFFITDFGLSHTIARYLSKYKVEGRSNEISNLLGVVGRVYFWLNVIIIILLALVYLFSEQIFAKLSTEEITKLKNVFVIVGFYSLLTFSFSPLDSLYIAYEKFAIQRKLDLINKLATVVIMIIFLLLGYGLYALVAVNAVVTIFILFIKLLISKKWFSQGINFSYTDKTLLKELFKFSFWVSVIGIAQRLMVNITPTILGIVSGTTQITIFSLAIVIDGYIWTIAHALNGLFLPELSRLEANENNKEEVTNLMIKVGRIQLLVMGMVFIGLIVLGKDFIQLWLGSGFSDLYYVILFLIIPSIITLTQEIAYTYLFVINELKYRAILFLTTSFISIAISFYLGGKYGAIGSAIGVFVTMMLCHVIGMNFIYWRKIGLDIPRFFVEVFSNQAFIWFFVIGIGFLLNNYLVAQNLWFSFIMKGCILSGFFILGQWFYGMRSSEKNMVKGILRGKL